MSEFGIIGLIVLFLISNYFSFFYGRRQGMEDAETTVIETKEQKKPKEPKHKPGPENSFGMFD